MKRFAVSLSALLLVGAVASPAVAGHDRVPSERVQKYVYDLDEVADNDPLGEPEGQVKLMALPNGKIQVTIEASGLAPGLPHAQHIHSPEDGDDLARGECPGIEADGNLGQPVDGLVNTLEGVPDYGLVRQSLTTIGPVSAPDRRGWACRRYGPPLVDRPAGATRDQHRPVRRFPARLG